MNPTPRRVALLEPALVVVMLVPGALLHAAEQRPAVPKPALRLYVATGGNDAHSGRLPEPNARKTDGPLATLERARDEIRKLKKQGGLAPGGVTVEIRAGLYERAGTFELGAEDSGTPDAPIEYRARAGEEVRLLGGRVVTGWKPVTDPAVLGRLDPTARGKVVRADLKALGITDYGQVKGGGLELFFQDRPMPLARGPNEGEIRIVDLLGGDQIKHPRDGTVIDRVGKFTYEGDRPKRWVGQKDVWLHGYWYRDWAEDYQKVESLDVQKRIITLAPPYHRYGFRKGQWFHAVNVLAEVDLPGEWYLDRQVGVLYFWPPTPIDQGRTVVSVLGDLVRMQNTSHVTLRGLVLEAARRNGILVTGGTGCKIAGCTVRNLGAWAVRISGGTRHGVAGCEISGTGDGGVVLSGGDRKTLTPAGHYAVNNHVHHFSRWNRMCRPAVQLSGVGNRVANNRIHDAPHQAMSFGGNDHLIELNEIYNVCYEANDGGAIYAGYNWTMRGTVIRHNFVHDVTGLGGRGCVGVYLDDMFSGVTISGNVFYRVTYAAFIGGGRDNVVQGNLFIECNKAMHVDARAMGWAKASVPGNLKTRLEAMPYKSPLWVKRYPKLPGTWEDEPAAPKGNVIAGNVFFRCKPWDDVTREARPYVDVSDNWATDEDPGLVDAANMDFRLKDDSPVTKRLPGFRKIPFRRIGLVIDEDRKSVPAR